MPSAHIWTIVDILFLCRHACSIAGQSRHACSIACAISISEFAQGSLPLKRGRPLNSSRVEVARHVVSTRDSAHSPKGTAHIPQKGPRALRPPPSGPGGHTNRNSEAKTVAGTTMCGRRARRRPGTSEHTPHRPPTPRRRVDQASQQLQRAHLRADNHHFAECGSRTHLRDKLAAVRRRPGNARPTPLPGRTTTTHHTTCGHRGEKLPLPQIRLPSIPFPAASGGRAAPPARRRQRPLEPRPLHMESDGALTAAMAAHSQR